MTRKSKRLERLANQRIYVESWIDGRLLRLSRHQTNILSFARSLDLKSQLRKELESRFGKPKNEDGFEMLVQYNKLPSLPMALEQITSEQKNKTHQIVPKATVLSEILILESDLHSVVESDDTTWLLGCRDVWSSSLKPIYSFDEETSDSPAQKKALIKTFRYLRQTLERSGKKTLTQKASSQWTRFLCPKIVFNCSRCDVKGLAGRRALVEHYYNGKCKGVKQGESWIHVYSETLNKFCAVARELENQQPKKKKSKKMDTHLVGDGRYKCPRCESKYANYHSFYFHIHRSQCAKAAKHDAEMGIAPNVLESLDMSSFSTQSSNVIEVETKSSYAEDDVRVVEEKVEDNTKEKESTETVCICNAIPDPKTEHLRSWVACDICSKWHHQDCVNVSAEDAENNWSCPSCVTNSTSSCTCGFSHDRGSGTWLACEMCERWVHCECANLTPEEAKNAKDFQCSICEESAKQEAVSDGIAESPEYVTCTRCKIQFELPKCVSLSSLLSNNKTWTCSQAFWEAQSTCVSGKHNNNTTAMNRKKLSNRVIVGSRHLLLLEDTMSRLVWGGDVLSSSSSSNERNFSITTKFEHSSWFKLRMVWRHHVEEARTYARLSVLLEMFKRCMGQAFWSQNPKLIRRRTTLLEKVRREAMIASDPELILKKKKKKKRSYRDDAIPVVPIPVRF